jgi:hypothetical protein
VPRVSAFDRIPTSALHVAQRIDRSSSRLPVIRGWRAAACLSRASALVKARAVLQSSSRLLRVSFEALLDHTHAACLARALLRRRWHSWAIGRRAARLRSAQAQPASPTASGGWAGFGGHRQGDDGVWASGGNAWEPVRLRHQRRALGRWLGAVARARSKGRMSVQATDAARFHGRRLSRRVFLSWAAWPAVVERRAKRHWARTVLRPLLWRWHRLAFHPPLRGRPTRVCTFPPLSIAPSSLAHASSSPSLHAFFFFF